MSKGIVQIAVVGLILIGILLGAVLFHDVIFGQANNGVLIVGTRTIGGNLATTLDCSSMPLAVGKECYIVTVNTDLDTISCVCFERGLL